MRTSFGATSAVVLALIAGCSGPLSPPPFERSSGSSSAIWTPEIVSPLPLSGPSRTFVFDHELSYPVDAGTKGSVWVLYDNGAYEFQYGGIPSRGVYKVEDGVFLCQGIPADQVAVIANFAVRGNLEGDVLTIDWDELSEESGWQDAVYVLTP